MSKKANLFQESIERLEDGDSLENFRASLPVEERATLSLVSRLLSAVWPERNPHSVAQQRELIIAQYRKESIMESNEQPRSNFFNSWRLPVAISAVFFILLICGLAFIISVGAVWVSTSKQVSLSQLPKFTFDKLVESVEPPDSAAESAGTFAESSDLAANEALLAAFRGLVEIRVGDNWRPADQNTILMAGAHLRTGSFSSAALQFGDGSLAQIGPNSELSIDELVVDLENNTREIVLMQMSGESSHTVVPFETETQTYQVNTPSSQGRVKGTQFHVRVDPEQTAWVVDSGAVEVSGEETAVQVGAGEMTSVMVDDEPTDPVEFITGQGVVTTIGVESWVIDDQSFQIHVQTIFVGNPQVGDLVFYEGHLEDGNPVADLIALVRRNPANTFTMTGMVEAIGDPNWIINGQEVVVPPEADIEGEIVEGDLVWVKGIILEGGVLQAEEVRLITEENATPFEFTGVVLSIGDQSWQISGVTVTVDENTVIDEGLVVGDDVRVKGWKLDEETWLATSITRLLDENSAFEFFGLIVSMGDIEWNVAGISFEVRDWTIKDDDLAVGDRVRVAGQIQSDGTWVAFEIHRYDDPLLTVLIGLVNSTDPWVVSGLRLNVDAETIIVGEIEVGMLVRVELQLLADGTHKVIRIEPFEDFDWEMSCQSVVVTVVSIDGDRITLEGFPAITLGEDTQIEGEIQPGSVVKTMLCYDEELNVVMVYIIVLENPEELPPEEDDDDENVGHKVLVCHNIERNPHTINIDESAVPAHLAHGDILGPCPPDLRKK